MPEASNATKSRLDKFIQGCSQLQEIYAVAPLHYTDIMGEWWQRINDVIYVLGLTEKQNDVVSIAWTVPELGKKRSDFFNEELATKKADGTDVGEGDRVSHVAGDGTGQNKAHKYGLIQSVDKLFQRNINTWGTLYEILYANSKDSSANPNGTARPVDLTDLIFGKAGLSADQVNSLLTDASRGLPADSQGLANSMKNVIENIIGTSLYDWLQEHSVNGADGIGGLEDLLFGTHDKTIIEEKINETTDNGSSSLFDKTNQIVDTIGENLYDWLNDGEKKCAYDYSVEDGKGPFTLEEMLFGNWSSDGTTITDGNGEQRETSASTPSWCQIVGSLKSGGLLTEIYNIVNYLGEPYDTYVDKVNKEKDINNSTIPVVSDEYLKNDPLHQLLSLDNGQVLYGGAKTTKNETTFENDWIFKEANICTSAKEVDNLIKSFKDQQKIFETYNRLSWANTNDDPKRNAACFPKVTPTSIVENGATVDAVRVDGYQMAYETYNVSDYEGEQTAVKTVRLMPYPTLETKIENRLGELPGFKKNPDSDIYVRYTTPQAYTANVVKGQWFNITKDGTYAGHACKKDDFLVCVVPSGSASASGTWKVINHDFPEFVTINDSRVAPSWDTHFEWQEVCDENNNPIRLKRNGEEGETVISKPQPPYNVGDIYSIGQTGRYLYMRDKNNTDSVTYVYFNCNEDDILICVNAKEAGEEVDYYDWNRVTRANIKRNASGRIEGFYKWWPNTQIISKESNPEIYKFWNTYTGPYASYINIPLFYSREEFHELLPTAPPEEDDADPNKSVWDPQYHEIYYYGSVGPDGEYETLPDDAKIGTALRIEAPGTYAGNICKMNDTLVCIQEKTSTAAAKWKNIHRNLNRNYGYVLSNAIITNYGVQNVQSSTMYVFPHTLTKKDIMVGTNKETYLTGCGCSWDTTTNDPLISGNLTSLIINKEVKTHSVAGNWTSGQTLTDAGASYSTMTIDMPYSSRYVPQKDSDQSSDGKTSKQFYWSYLYSWIHHIYKNETLVLKQMLFEELQTGWGNSQWVAYDGDIDESTKNITLRDPKFAVINGITYPVIKKNVEGVQKWGIMWNGKFNTFTQMAVNNRRDRPQYDTCFQVVRYSTEYQTIYRGRDGNDNIQMTFTGSGDATKAISLLDANRLHRIERLDRTISTKKSWVFTSTQANVTQNGVATRISTPKITETETVYTSDCIRMRFIDTTALNSDPNRSTIAGNPSQYPFTTQKRLKETANEALLNPNDTDSCYIANQYGRYGATSVQKTTTKTWTLDGTMKWVDDADNSDNSHWNISGTWKQNGRTSVTETVNRPLRLVYYWDVMYYFKYRAWLRKDSMYNAKESYYIDWTTYNIADIETKVANWIQNTNPVEGLGIPVNTISSAYRAEMNSWYMAQEGDEYVIKIGTNSSSLVALTSNKKYGNFKFDCTPSSYTDDDDNLGIVVSHVKDHTTGLDNALIVDRWSTGLRLRLNGDITLADINTKPVLRNLNGAYSQQKIHYAEGIHYPIITQNGETYTEGDCTTPYNLADFECGEKNWTNTGMFIWKMYTQHEGPTSYGTTETVYTGIEYTDTLGEKQKGTGIYQNVRNSAQSMLDLIKPDDNGNLKNIILSRSFSPTDTNKIKNASNYNNVYGSWVVPFHTKKYNNVEWTADLYWSKLNTPVQNEIKSCIKAMIRDENNNAPTDSEAIAIFKTVVFPRYELSTFNVADFTLDDARKLHHATQWMSTLQLDQNATTLNLNIQSFDAPPPYASDERNKARWIFAGYGWLNLYTGVDLNFRTIVERNMNTSTNSYDLLITYKDVLHRIASTKGSTKRKLSTGWVKLDADPGFNWHNSNTNNQKYKGDILFKIWKTVTTNNTDSYNILVWQLRGGVTAIPLVLVNISNTSLMKTRTYSLTPTGDNIPLEVEEGEELQIETDYKGIPLKRIMNSDNDIYQLTSSESETDYSTRNLYKIFNQLMTSIVSYGYVNCSNPLSEYKKIKFVDTTSGEIYDLANNKIWVPNEVTNEYEIDESKNYNVEQAIMKKFGIGRFLYNSETSHMFFTRGDTDSVQQIL